MGKKRVIIGILMFSFLLIAGLIIYEKTTEPECAVIHVDGYVGLMGDPNKLPFSKLEIRPNTRSAEWVVSWDVTSIYSVPCEQPKPVPDEFGRTQASYTMTLQACWDGHTDHMRKAFKSLKEAEAFVEKGMAEPPDFMGNQHLSNFKIHKEER